MVLNFYKLICLRGDRSRPLLVDEGQGRDHARVPIDRHDHHDQGVTWGIDAAAASMSVSVPSFFFEPRNMYEPAMLWRHW